METYGKLDSKFRFVIVASKRAKQLLRGAKPKIRSKSRSPIRVAQSELKEGLLEFEILTPRLDGVLEAANGVFTPGEVEEVEEGGLGIVDDETEPAEAEPEVVEEEGPGFDEIFPELGIETDKEED